ncbi:TNF receptor-associated factor 5-like [Clytia hemisphaerica]|uniref:Uncharacterized protein n=1 Tax=Clytia hemisphaerica TaxID=252671 RepID=A0A7M5TU77_9CNID
MEKTPPPFNTGLDEAQQNINTISSEEQPTDCCQDNETVQNQIDNREESGDRINISERCTLCLNQIESESSITQKQSLKCLKCLKIIESVPSGFPFEMTASYTVKEYECPICLVLIRDATELPCKHLMCRECLIHYENGVMGKSADESQPKFICSICQAEYRMEEKFEVKSTDRIIQTSLPVYCKQATKGCQWTGCIKDYQDHTKYCDYLLVPCPNEGCVEEIMRLNLITHKNNCQFRNVACPFCKQMICFNELWRHHGVCPRFKIPCPNKGCMAFVKRSKVPKHCQEECEFQLVQCQYSDLGCSLKVLKKDIHIHMKEEKFKHELLLLSTVKEMKLNEQVYQNKIENLEKMIVVKDEKLNKTQNKLMEVQLQLSQTVSKLTNIDMEVENLKSFANISSMMHSVLSHPMSQMKISHGETLFQRNYWRSENVQKWRCLMDQISIHPPKKSHQESEPEMSNEKLEVCIKNSELEARNINEDTEQVEEKVTKRQENAPSEKQANKDNTTPTKPSKECNYLKTLYQALEQYSKTIHCPTYSERLWQLYFNTESGHVSVDGEFMKISCPFHAKTIKLKTFYDLQQYNQEIHQSKHKWCQNSYYLAWRLNQDGGLEVNLFLTHEKYVWLLHREEEHRRIPLTEDGTEQLINSGYIIIDSIILATEWCSNILQTYQSNSPNKEQGNLDKTTGKIVQLQNIFHGVETSSMF